MSALRKVPIDMSYLAEAETAWKDFTARILKSEVASPSMWGRIDRMLHEGRQKLANKELHAEYDWDLDLFLAERHHATQTEWAQNCFKQLEKMEANWLQMADNGQRYVQELATIGIKLAFTAHGAIGLGCLAILGHGSSKLPDALMASCIVAAMLGMAILALGVIVMVETIPSGSVHIRSRLGSMNSYRKFTKLARVWSTRIDPKLTVANILIYGSIGWLIFYVICAMIVVLHL